MTVNEARRKVRRKLDRKFGERMSPGLRFYTISLEGGAMGNRPLDRVLVARLETQVARYSIYLLLYAKPQEGSGHKPAKEALSAYKEDWTPDGWVNQRSVHHGPEGPVTWEKISQAIPWDDVVPEVEDRELGTERTRGGYPSDKDLPRSGGRSSLVSAPRPQTKPEGGEPL
jgi:hypothetical protein